MLTATDEFLSRADVAALTDKAQARLQCAELDRRGIPYLLSPKGWPQVSRFHVRQIALGVEVRQSGAPNWSAVK